MLAPPAQSFRRKRRAWFYESTWAPPSNGAKILDSITGSSVYVDDLQLTGMVHIAFVRSIYAHANIKGIDTSEALSMPGVIAVMTAADLEKVLPSKYEAIGER